MCDACHNEAVKRLRQLKPRPHKPLVLLFPDDQTEAFSGLKPFVTLEKYHIDWLRSAMRPIVMVNQAQNTPLSGEIAPGLAEVGMMLACSPLHILLMDAFGGPLVATSALCTHPYSFSTSFKHSSSSSLKTKSPGCPASPSRSPTN